MLRHTTCMSSILLSFDERLCVSAGDQIEVTGSKITMSGADSIVAREIKKDGKVSRYETVREFPLVPRTAARKLTYFRLDLCSETKVMQRISAQAEYAADVKVYVFDNSDWFEAKTSNTNSNCTEDRMIHKYLAALIFSAALTASATAANRQAMQALPVCLFKQAGLLSIFPTRTSNFACGSQSGRLRHRSHSRSAIPRVERNCDDSQRHPH